jgi:hypothetical protein
VTVLDLTPDMIVTPGWRVIERNARRLLAKSAAERAETRRLRDAKLAMEVAMLREARS